jgi:excisionase family DNA binding protein
MRANSQAKGAVGSDAGASLDSLAAAPELVQSLPRSAVTAMLARCAALQAALFSRLLTVEDDSRNEDAMDAFLTVPDVARLLKLREPYVYQLIQRRELAAIKTGKYLRVPRSAIAAWQRGHLLHPRTDIQRARG